LEEIALEEAMNMDKLLMNQARLLYGNEAPQTDRREATLPDSSNFSDKRRR
jgi:hypothetical protein